MLFSSEAQGFGLHNLTHLPYINLNTPRGEDPFKSYSILKMSGIEGSFILYRPNINKYEWYRRKLHIIIIHIAAGSHPVQEAWGHKMHVYHKKMKKKLFRYLMCYVLYLKDNAFDEFG